jgi:hypothetical protein
MSYSIDSIIFCISLSLTVAVQILFQVKNLIFMQLSAVTTTDRIPFPWGGDQRKLERVVHLHWLDGGKGSLSPVVWLQVHVSFWTCNVVSSQWGFLIVSLWHLQEPYPWIP